MLFNEKKLDAKVDINIAPIEELLKTYNVAIGTDYHGRKIYEEATLFEYYGSNNEIYTTLLQRIGPQIIEYEFPDNENILHITVRTNNIANLELLFQIFGYEIISKLANCKNRFNLQPIAYTKLAEMFVILSQFTDINVKSLRHAIDYSYDVAEYVKHATAASTVNNSEAYDILANMH